jgi:trans-2-enoyl-CoA reductase
MQSIDFGTTQCVLLDQHGPIRPGCVRVAELPLAPPSIGEVSVQVVAAPINPADLNVIEGKYPIRPSLPGVLGIEGVARVTRRGANVAETDFMQGSLVLLPPSWGTWREAGTVSTERLIRLPEDVDPLQAAMLRINPATAWRMLHDFAALHPGDWVVQNAANSGVGRAVIQIARELGLKTLNLVRREELIPELHAIGADLVVLDDDEPVRRAAKAVRSVLALNAVGGASAGRVARCLIEGGTVVTYGGMAREPLALPVGPLIFQDLRWRGFWVSRWYKAAAHSDIAAMFSKLIPLIQRGTLRTPIEQTFQLNSLDAALMRANCSARSGKLLLTFSE